MAFSRRRALGAFCLFADSSKALGRRKLLCTLLQRLAEAIVLSFVDEIRSEASVDNLQFRFFFETLDQTFGNRLTLLLNEGNGLIESDGQRISAWRKADELLLVQHVVTIASSADNNLIALELTEGSG